MATRLAGRRRVEKDLIDVPTLKVFSPEMEFYREAIELGQQHDVTKLWERTAW